MPEPIQLNIDSGIQDYLLFTALPTQIFGIAGPGQQNNFIQSFYVKKLKGLKAYNLDAFILTPRDDIVINNTLIQKLITVIPTISQDGKSLILLAIYHKHSFSPLETLANLSVPCSLPRITISLLKDGEYIIDYAIFPNFYLDDLTNTVKSKNTFTGTFSINTKIYPQASPVGGPTTTELYVFNRIRTITTLEPFSNLNHICFEYDSTLDQFYLYLWGFMDSIPRQVVLRTVECGIPPHEYTNIFFQPDSQAGITVSTTFLTKFLIDKTNPNNVSFVSSFIDFQKFLDLIQVNNINFTLRDPQIYKHLALFYEDIATSETHNLTSFYIDFFQPNSPFLNIFANITISEVNVKSVRKTVKLEPFTTMNSTLPYITETDSFVVSDFNYFNTFGFGFNGWYNLRPNSNTVLECADSRINSQGFSIIGGGIILDDNGNLVIFTRKYKIIEDLTAPPYEGLVTLIKNSSGLIPKELDTPSFSAARNFIYFQK